MAQQIVAQVSGGSCRAWIDGNPSQAATGPTAAEAVRMLKRRFPECQLYQARLINPVMDVSLDASSEVPVTAAAAIRNIHDSILAAQTILTNRMKAIQTACKHVDDKNEDARMVIIDAMYDLKCEICGALW